MIGLLSVSAGRSMVEIIHIGCCAFYCWLSASAGAVVGYFGAIVCHGWHKDNGDA